MKLKYLTESEELWASGSSDVPASQYKLSSLCNVRPLKALLKTLSDPKEIEDAINSYSRTYNVKYVGSVKYNGSTFYRFDPENPYGETFWYCKDYSNDYNFETLKYEIPEGTILVANMGYTMTLYDFYRVEKYQGKSVVLSKLEKIRTGGDSFRPYVKPSNKSEESRKFKLVIPKGDRDAYVSLGYHNNLYFNKDHIYKESYRYQEDHLD